MSAFLAPQKSAHPDGLDSVAQAKGFDSLEAEREPLLLSDYAIPLPEGFGWPSIATSLAGILGTCVVFVIAFVLGRAARWNATPLVADGGHAN